MPPIDASGIHVDTADEAEWGRIAERLRLLETAVANLSDLVVILEAIPLEEPGPRIVYVNDAFVRRTGYSRDELVGRSPRMLMGPKSDPEVLVLIRNSMEQRAPVRTELVSYGRDGTPFWLDTIILPLLDEKGEPTHFVSVQRDITDRRRAEQELRDSESRYRLLFEENPSPMWVFDTETLNILAVNEAAIAHYGWSREEFLGMSIRDVRPPMALPQLLALLSRQERGRNQIPELVRHIRKDGTPMDVEIASHSLTWEGHPARLVLITDVTERVKAQAEQARLAAIIESSDDAIVSTSTDGSIVTWNRGAERMFGYTHDEMVGRSVFELIPEERRDEESQLLLRTRGGKRTLHHETECMSRAGERVPVAITLSALLNEDGVVAGVAFSIRDVSDQRALEERLRQAQRMEAVGRLAGGIAHDFNNLLTAIDGHTSFLLEDLPPEHSSRGDAQEIRSAVVRASSLTRQLLAFGRKQVLELRVVDAAAVVNEVERLLRRVIGEDVELVAKSDGPAHVRADSGQLEQVLLNLAVNARDAMPSGGVLQVETRCVQPEDVAKEVVLPPAHAPDGVVLLSVTDTGIGMDARTRAQAFEPFFTTKPAGKGTGLGLATVYGIVAQSGGTCWIDSTVGMGTTVSVALPAVAEEAARASHRPTPAAAEPLPSPGSTILVVEDEPAVRTTLRRLLAGRGYTVLEASNGMEALSTWREARARGVSIAGVITDVVMPEMGGRDLARRLREEEAELPVLFTSGYVEDRVLPDLATEIHRDPHMGFMQKPFRAHDLISALAELLQQ